MGRATFAILAVLCCTWAAAEQAVNPPPHPLHKIGEHWTPYTPPTEFPADVQVYTIQKGDTLWALAKRFLGNPYLWPQLWEKNKYIRDAHWIYPGDPLIIGPKTEEVSPTEPSAKVEFRGVVDALPPTSDLTGDWTVSGRTVHVTPSTKLDQRRGSAEPGATVTVEGAGRSDGSVDADKIAVLGFTGVIESLPGTRDLTGDWRVSGHGVHVTPSTKLDQERGPATPGAKVEVEGARRPDGSVDADRIAVVESAGGTAGAGGAPGAGEAGGSGAGRNAPGAAGTGGATIQGSGGAAGELIAVGSEDDIYCFAYLDDKDSKPTLTITSAEQIDYQDNFSTGDIIYLSGGEAEGVKAGQEFFIVQPVRKLRHPATNAVLGTVMRYLGHARVLCTQDHNATAEILASCDAINIGAWLRPFDAIPIPMTVMTPPVTRCDPASNKAKGYLVYSKDDDITIGQDHLVLVDLGDADQVSPGTQATVYRDNPVAGALPLLLGEIAVLTTGDHWASAKVIRSAGPMQVGDRVELK